MLQQEGFKFHLDIKNNKALPLDPTYGHNELAPTSAPWRMDDKWSKNNFFSCFNSLANHSG
jgi:hypothetical protein